MSRTQALDRTWYSLAHRAKRYARDGNVSRDGTQLDTGEIDERPNGMAMSSPGTTRLRFEPDRTVLASGGLLIDASSLLGILDLRAGTLLRRC